MSGCGSRKCAKKKKRESRGLQKIQREYVATERISGGEEVTDCDSILTETTDYQTIPARSIGSDRSKPARKRKTKFQRLEFSDSVSGSETTKNSSKCATINLSKFADGDSTEPESFDDDDYEEYERYCEELSCGGGKYKVRTKRYECPSDSESTEDSTNNSSLKCPDLCANDPTKLPEEKPKKCDIDCRRQVWLQQQRERKQAEFDDYLLRKGFRYFDDMCKCSLQCVMAQMCQDPFVRNIAVSTVGFILGLKLCWELDGYYILF